MDESGRIREIREHWDARYAIAGREPLRNPNPGFMDWINTHDDTRPVLLIGDGEGRNALAVPTSHPVTMVELSPVGAARCRAVASRPVEVVVAEAFSWLRASGRRWPLVAMLYLQALTPDEDETLREVLHTACDLGGGFYLELARAGLPMQQQHSLCQEFQIEAHDVSSGGVERIQLCC